MEHDFQEFPKWKYNPTNHAVIVENADAESALGKGWVDLPVVQEVSTPEVISEIPESITKEIESVVEKVEALSKDSKASKKAKS